MPGHPRNESIPDREAIAKREIGVTAVRPATAVGLALFFLLTIGGVPVVQAIYERALAGRGIAASGIAGVPAAGWNAAADAIGLRGPAGAVFAANGAILREIDAFETALEDGFFVTERWLPYVQEFNLRWLGAGNEQVYPGLRGWLFFRRDVDTVTGPGFLERRVLRARALAGDATVGDAVQPDPVPAIVAFAEDLAARGIRLVVVPTPVKPMLEPGYLSARYAAWAAGPIRNPSFPEWMGRLQAAGVDVFDPAPVMASFAEATGQPVFLETDTHWTPDAMERVAAALAEHLEAGGGLGSGPEGAWDRSPAEVDGHGDIAAMLNLPPRSGMFPPQRVTIRSVTRDGKAFAFDRSSEVLLLGDSFSNIFSLEALGWGSGAGFGEQLGFALRRPVDAILRNDAGASATREILQRELARGDDRLAGKRVVVWQFAERELSDGDWKILPLPEGDASGESPDGGYFVPEPGAPPRRATGRVAAAAPVPRPGTVPYRDHIFAAHLVGLEGDGIPPGSRAVVYFFGMRDNTLTPAAAWRPGEQVAVVLQAWDNVSDEFERLNRSELDDLELQLEIPAWGEPILEADP